MTAYFTLFIWAFLASTIIPLGVEPLYVYQVYHSQNLWTNCMAASAGNTMGSITLIYMGIKGSPWLQKKFLTGNDSKISKITPYIRNYGYPLLLLSWVPVIGDLIVVLFGFTQPKIIPSILFLAVGKTSRFIILGWWLVP
jgi:membrane protein YqaA with SNARE-associated domain